ncbi:MAG: hypothetical protein J6N45_07285, partial [Alphaproteobacteria bacterium]|nr:hypothetical protein [Alphaproteobacteria bacterium]
MAEKDLLNDEDDFEKLLNNFINSKDDDSNYSTKNSSDSPFIELNESDKEINQELSNEIEEDLAASLAAGKEEAVANANQPNLGSDESELAQAFINFQTSVNKLSAEILKQKFECSFVIDDLYPNYKPSVGRLISADVVNGWLLLSKMFPNDIGKFSPSSSDEEFLNFAEKLNNQDLQLAVISYVEVLIDMESCELS